MYDDRPYVTARPDEVASRLDRCPQMGEKPTKTPDWNLERWKAVRDLIAGWYGDDRPDSELVPELVEGLCGWMDAAQREVVEQLFAGWRAMYPKLADVAVDLDPPAVSVIDHAHRVELKAKPAFTLTHPSGEVEVIRLRTGSGGTSQAEAAVLHQEKAPGTFFVDAFVAAGSAEEIADPVDRPAIVERLVAAAGEPGPRRLIPGVHCFSCSSAPRCGQYPPAEGGRVFNSTRSLMVSKTLLDWVDVCQRRVAWDRLHQLPKDRDDEMELGGRLATGLLFHRTAAAAIGVEDPEPILAAAMRESSPSEASELRRLWDNHVRLWDEEGRPELRSTELWAGFTLMAPGIRVDSRGRSHEEPVAVTFVGALDATGREADGTPMVVEHRTGAGGDHGHLEAELYAVSAASLIGSRSGSPPERVAVHLHHLRPEDPHCERRVFERDDLASALASFGRVAGVMAGWHPVDSLSPPFQVGPWCGSCHHRRRCERFR